VKPSFVSRWNDRAVVPWTPPSRWPSSCTPEPSGSSQQQSASPVRHIQSRREFEPVLNPWLLGMSGGVGARRSALDRAVDRSAMQHGHETDWTWCHPRTTRATLVLEATGAPVELVTQASGSHPQPAVGRRRGHAELTCRPSDA